MPTSDFFLLPTTLQYAKFEKVGIKNAKLATLVPAITASNEMTRKNEPPIWSCVRLSVCNFVRWEEDEEKEEEEGECWRQGITLRPCFCM